MSINNPYTPPSSDTQTTEPQMQGPKGLGGWLILVAIIILTNLIYKLFQVIGATSIIVNVPTGFIKIPPYNYLFYIYITYILLASCWIIVCFLFFTKKRLFKITFNSILILQLVISISALIILFISFPQISWLTDNKNGSTYKTGHKVGSFFFPFLWTILWCRYTSTSKRVANTFVN